MNTSYKHITNDEHNREISDALKKFDEEENTIKKNDGKNGVLTQPKNGGRRHSTARPLPRRRSSKRKSRKARSTRRR